MRQEREQHRPVVETRWVPVVLPVMEPETGAQAAQEMSQFLANVLDATVGPFVPELSTEDNRVRTKKVLVLCYCGWEKCGGSYWTEVPE